MYVQFRFKWRWAPKLIIMEHRCIKLLCEMDSFFELLVSRHHTLLHTLLLGHSVSHWDAKPDPGKPGEIISASENVSSLALTL